MINLKIRLNAKNIFGFIIAPLVFFLITIFIDLQPGKPEVTYTLAIALLMAIWWITEIVPLAVTALLPVVLFPLFGVMNGKDVSATYFNHVIFLFIGGFIVALAMQKWNLHKRIALKILMITGSSPARILLGFMIATAFLSMWISNTATAMMMVPILLSIISKLEEIGRSPEYSEIITGSRLFYFGKSYYVELTKEERDNIEVDFIHSKFKIMVPLQVDSVQINEAGVGDFFFWGDRQHDLWDIYHHVSLGMDELF